MIMSDPPKPTPTDDDPANRKEANIESVTTGYDALDREDIERFIQLCAADAVWIYPPSSALAYGGTWRGRDGIAAFFEAHDAAEEILEFKIDDLLAVGDRVIAMGLFRGKAKPSLREWQTRFVHVITLRDGLWQQFEAHFDTAAAADAHR